MVTFYIAVLYHFTIIHIEILTIINGFFLFSKLLAQYTDLNLQSYSYLIVNICYTNFVEDKIENDVQLSRLKSIKLRAWLNVT